MDSLYFSAMIIGIAWLALWGAMPEGLPFSSPFDMREEQAKLPETETLPASQLPAVPRGTDATMSRPESARLNAASSWRQRRQSRRVEVMAAKMVDGLPERRPAASWRTRRDVPSGSRRRR
jgi:hypothetical protein